MLEDTAITRTSSPIGRDTMSRSMPQALRYHRYLLEKALPYLVSPVWELGMGYGQYTEMLLERGFKVVASDIDPELVQNLNQLKLRHPGNLDLAIVNLNDQQTIRECAKHLPKSLICFNVLEHIDQDLRALKWLNESLPNNTTLIFATPAHSALYGFMDRQAGHFRRYSVGSLSSRFEEAGFIVERAEYINPIGALGWLWRNRCSEPKDTSLDSATLNSEIRFFDRYLVTPTRLLEPLFRRIFGLSVLVVAKKVA